MSGAAIRVRQAAAADVATIESLLREAAAWVDALGVVMWEAGELERDEIERDVSSDQFFVAEVDGDPAGIVRFQLEDELFWPDLPPGRSAFVHRIVVRRAYKGTGVSAALLQWAADRALSLGLDHLLLDCDANRPKLRLLYERFGFRFHSYRQVGPYYVARYEYPLRSHSDAET